MLFGALLILGYGPLDWSFPRWVWVLGAAFQVSENIYRSAVARKAKQ